MVETVVEFGCMFVSGLLDAWGDVRLGECFSTPRTLSRGGAVDLVEASSATDPLWDREFDGWGHADNPSENAVGMNSRA